MVRSAAALVAVLILPASVHGQQPVGTHTVVRDETLWGLAVRYYQNPFQWRAIYEANRDSIANPNLIYPNEVFVIPGLAGDGGQTVATAPTQPVPDQAVVDQPASDQPASDQPASDQPPPDEPTISDEPTTVESVPAGPVDLVQFGFRQARPAEQVRTVFHADTTSRSAEVMRAQSAAYLAVTRDAVYSAPWLVPLASIPENSGAIAGFATEGARASTIRSFDLVRVDMPSPARVGAELQIFRVDRSIENVGEVVIPTGVLTVSTIDDTGVVGVVTKEYQRIQPGDFVRPVPPYSLRRGQYAQEVSGGSEAMIMGFAGRQMLNDLGHIAFLDLGSNDGITIGDEFILYGAAVGAPEGSLQVVGTTRTTSAARIVSMVDDVFKQGLVVRLARKMR